MRLKTILVPLLMAACLQTIGQNQNLSDGFVFDGEPYIAVNPANASHIVAAWMGFQFQHQIVIKTRTSFNGGRSWSNISTIQHVQQGFTSADVSLSFNRTGDVFICNIDYDPAFGAGGVYVRKSTDGGLTWNEAVQAIGLNSDPGMLPIDRPWLVCNQSYSPFSGNLYITTVSATGAAGPLYHPYLIRSTDYGATFEPWQYADTAGWLAGSMIPKPMAAPAVTADGSLILAYPSYVPTQNILPQFVLAVSSDGGIGFNYSNIFASTASASAGDTSAKKGYCLMADPSLNGHYAFIYQDSPLGDRDIYCRETFDTGNSWSNAIRVNDDQAGNERMQDLSWAAFNQLGDLAICWRDRRHASDSGYATRYEMYAAVKYHDSVTFHPNFRLTDAEIDFDEVLLLNGNDFSSIAFVNDTIHAVWGDTRSGKLNIWYQRTSAAGVPLGLTQLDESVKPQLKVSGNGSGYPIRIRYQNQEIEEWKLISLEGKLCDYGSFEQPTDEFMIHDSPMQPGVYILMVMINGDWITAKIKIH